MDIWAARPRDSLVFREISEHDLHLTYTSRRLHVARIVSQLSTFLSRSPLSPAQMSQPLPPPPSIIATRSRQLYSRQGREISLDLFLLLGCNGISIFQEFQISTQRFLWKIGGIVYRIVRFRSKNGRETINTHRYLGEIDKRREITRRV